MNPLALSSRTSASNSGPMTAPAVVPAKNTVQFSEVAEYAQLLQVKYGTRCKDHPWGCVEIASGQHLELTIKMYLDWAGLVVSPIAFAIAFGFFPALFCFSKFGGKQ